MSLKIPILDDRNYDDLVAEAIAMIPRYAPAWTNYNASDPGITLIELLAYFTELLIYRLDRISLENKINFLKLLTGATGTCTDFDQLKTASLDEIDALLKKTILALKQPQRAVTTEDYEFLAKQAILSTMNTVIAVKTHCFFSKNLNAIEKDPDTQHPGHVSLVLIAGETALATEGNKLIQEVSHNAYKTLVEAVTTDLECKCLLTTKLHVAAPRYLGVMLAIETNSARQKPLENLSAKFAATLERYFSPFAGGGREGKGWPLGRHLQLSEVIAVIEQLPEVDYVENLWVLALSTQFENLRDRHAAIGLQIGVRLSIGRDAILGSHSPDNKERLIMNGTGVLTGIRLKPYELIKVLIVENHFIDFGQTAAQG
ncbi:MAG: hypothetical protein HOP34_12975 [Methylococcaceae bacterium]|nr:hypothetical protein [Methylococcaceae bacterium]